MIEKTRQSGLGIIFFQLSTTANSLRQFTFLANIRCSPQVIRYINTQNKIKDALQDRLRRHCARHCRRRRGTKLRRIVVCTSLPSIQQLCSSPKLPSSVVRFSIPSQQLCRSPRLLSRAIQLCSTTKLQRTTSKLCRSPKLRSTISELRFMGFNL